jgi:hypothetical protein
MRNNTLTFALSAMAIVALGFVTAAQQKPPAKTAAPTAITVYKTPT